MPPMTQINSAMKSIEDIVGRWPSREAEEWVRSFIPIARAYPSILAIVAFGAAIRTKGFTADIDLLVIYRGAKPLADGRPIDVDIRWYEEAQAERLIEEGQELLGWVVRFGELVWERQGYWSKIREQWRDRMPFPSAKIATDRVERAWNLYRELEGMGDVDAALEQRLVALTQEARAFLIQHGIYPASRPELPEQLRAANEVRLAEKLELALHEREAA